MKRIVGLIVIALVVSACNSVSMPKDAMSDIGDVQVSFAGPMPEKAVENDGTQGGAGLGAVGALVEELGKAAPGKWVSRPMKVTNFVNEHKIDLPGMVVAEFKRQLALKPGFANRLKDSAPNKFNVRIVSYGVFKPAFSLNFKPVLNLQADLTDASGRVVWRQADFVLAHGESPEIPFNQLLSSPEEFTKEYDSAIRDVVGLVLAKLN